MAETPRNSKALPERLALAVAVAVIVWLLAVIVRIENERYALLVGSCRHKAIPDLVDLECLRTVQTRTAWYAHLFYALSGR